MNFARNLRLGKRLGLGFGLMLVLMAGLVAVSLSRLSSQNAAMQSVTAQIYPTVEASQGMAYAVLDLARVARNLILLTDKGGREKNMGFYQKDKADIDANLALLDRLVDSDEGRSALAKVKSTGAEYLAYTAEVIETANTATPDKATGILYGPKLAKQSAYLDALREMIAIETGRMKAASAAAAEAHDNAFALLLGLAGVAIVLGGVCAWLITRSITAPIAEAAGVARAVAAGDLTSQVVDDQTDEVGELLVALKAMNANLAGMVGAVRDSSESIATGASQIATGNADLSQRTEQQASNLQQTAASMEQMQSTVKQNADTARTATQLAASASTVALQGGEVVAKVVSTMDHISASSRKIADIVGVIDGIAFQTNILALNAAVEAARAGEQGRGFAVVAGEVRSLARRSAESAREIKKLIAESVEAVESGTRLVGGAGTTMTDIVGQVRRVADLIGEMSASTDEQAKGMGQVSEAVTQLDRVTQQNAALVEESAAAADSLKQQSLRMAELVRAFKVGPDAVRVAAVVPVVALAAVRKTFVAPAVKPAAKAPAVKAPVAKAPVARAPVVKAPAAPRAKPAALVAPAAAGEDWESF